MRDAVDKFTVQFAGLPRVVPHVLQTEDEEELKNQLVAEEAADVAQSEVKTKYHNEKYVVAKQLHCKWNLSQSSPGKFDLVNSCPLLFGETVPGLKSDG